LAHQARNLALLSIFCFGPLLAAYALHLASKAEVLASGPDMDVVRTARWVAYGSIALWLVVLLVQLSR